VPQHVEPFRRGRCSDHGAFQCTCGRPLTLPSSGRPPARFACLRPPLMSNVRAQALIMPSRLRYLLMAMGCAVVVGICIYVSRPFVLPLALGCVAAAVGVIGLRARWSPTHGGAFFNCGVVAASILLIGLSFFGSREAPSTMPLWPYFLQFLGSAWGVWCVSFLLPPTTVTNDEP
jgi:hypothetical protein